MAFVPAIGVTPPVMPTLPPAPVAPVATAGSAQATAGFSGGSDLYGAVVVKYLTATGGAAIHYDRSLQNSGFTAGNSK